MACQITIHEIERHRIRVEAEFVRPDGTVWMRIRRLGRLAVPLAGPLPRRRSASRATIWSAKSCRSKIRRTGSGPVRRAVWLEPPADMGRPVWRDVLEQTQLGPEERAVFLADGGYRAAAIATALGSNRGQGGRPAALGRRAAGRPTYPADLAIVADEHGRPRLTHRGTARLEAALPAISIAHADGVAVALAALDPAARVGIDVEPIVDRPAELRSLGIHAGRACAAGSLAGPSRAEWVARFWCAKEAAAKASGLGSAAGPTERRSDRVRPRIRASFMSGWPPNSRRRGRMALSTNPCASISARRGDHAWAWTLGKGIES